MPAGRWSWRTFAAKAISAKLTLAERAVHHAAFDADLGDVGLQQMRADALDLFGQHRGRSLADRAAGEHDRARGEGAEAEGRRSRCRHSGSRCASGSIASSCAAICASDVSWPWPWFCTPTWMMTRAVGQHAGVGEFVARDHARLALHPSDGAVAALLGVERKADADGAAVRLAALPGACGSRRDRSCRARIRARRRSRRCRASCRRRCGRAARRR